MGIRTVSTLVMLSALAWGPPAWADRYRVDPAHTSVLFHVRHLFTSVTGRFEKFDGTIDYDEQAPDKTHVSGTIDAASINTNVEKRDNHLRSADFFDAEKFPKLTFESSGVTDIDSSGHKGKMKGTLTMHGVSRPVILDVSFLGKGKDPGGHERAGFHATTTVNRKDFGLNWNKALESGGLLVGDEVTIDLDIEAAREA